MREEKPMQGTGGKAERSKPLGKNWLKCESNISVKVNTLNAELNPICHLLVLLRDLTFMGPCIVSIFQYISNKMQRYTFIYI
jgi:hypothetical protein